MGQSRTDALIENYAALLEVPVDYLYAEFLNGGETEAEVSNIMYYFVPNIPNVKNSSFSPDF